LLKKISDDLTKLDKLRFNVTKKPRTERTHAHRGRLPPSPLRLRFSTTFISPGVSNILTLDDIFGPDITQRMHIKSIYTSENWYVFPKGLFDTAVVGFELMIFCS
jgi:hypothetical protein